MNPVPLIDPTAGAAEPAAPEALRAQLRSADSWASSASRTSSSCTARGDRGRGQPGHAVARRAAGHAESRRSTGRPRSPTPTGGTTTRPATRCAPARRPTPVLLDFEGTPLIGVSADKVLLQISDFIHVTGSFAFRLGPVAPGRRRHRPERDCTAASVPLLATITNVTDTDDGTFGRSTDFRTLWNLPVNTIQVGASGVSVFVGYASGLSGWSLEDRRRRDPVRGRAPRLARSASSSENLTLGLMLMNPVPFIDPLLVPLNADPAEALLAQGRRGRHRPARASRASSSRATASRVEVNLGTRFPTPRRRLPRRRSTTLKSFPDSTGPTATPTPTPTATTIQTGTTTDRRPPRRSRASSSAAGPRTSTSSSASSSTSTARSTSSIGQVHHVQLADAILPIGEIARASSACRDELESVHRRHREGSLVPHHRRQGPPGLLRRQRPVLDRRERQRR